MKSRSVVAFLAFGAGDDIHIYVIPIISLLRLHEKERES